MLEQLSENLDMAEAKKNGLRKSILMLMGDWREFEKHLEGTQKRFQEWFLELESREKNLNSVQESVRQSCEELKCMREVIEKRVREVEDKEKALVLLQEKARMELAAKEKEMELSREKLVEEFGEKEGKLNGKEMLMNGLYEKLEIERNELVELEKLVEERLREVGLKEECVEEKRKEIEFIQDGITKRVNELDDRERKVKEREKMVGFKGLDALRVDRERTIEMKEKEVGLIREDLELKKKEVGFLLSVNDKRMKEWDTKEKQLEIKKKELEITHESVKEIQLKKMKILEEKELLERGNKELELKKKELEDNSIKSLKELEVSEKQLEAKWKQLEVAEKSLKGLELKKKEVGFLLAMNDKLMKEWDTKEKQLEVKKKELEITHESVKEIQLKKMKILEEKELLERGNKELELKKKELEDNSIKGLKELEVSEKQLEAKWKQLEVVEKSLTECEFKKKHCQSEKELLEDRIKELEVKRKELEGSIKDMKELEVREKQLEAKRKQLEDVEQESFKERELKNELLEKGNKELELKREEFEDRIKAFEIREKEFEVQEKKLNDNKLHARQPVKKVVDGTLNSDSSSSNFTLGVELDGLDVHMSLNSLKIDLSSKDEVLKALRLSGAPVFVVLNAIETLYPPYLRKVDMEFEGTVARSCIALLEQLIRVSPKIQSNERDKALKLAREWKAMMTERKPLEVLGFLYLLAAFNLASAFDTGVVMKCLITVAEHHQIPELCPHLGLRDKIPGVIQNLLNNHKHSLQVISLIYAFDLVDQFPPVPILKSYLRHVKSMMKTMAKNTGAKNDAIDQRVAAARAVLKCIIDHKLESKYPPKLLEASIQQLLMQKVQNKCSESVILCKVHDMKLPSTSESDVNVEVQDQKEVEEEGIPSTISPICLKDCKNVTELSNTNIGPPDAMALIIANMNGKSLLSFLNLHIDDHSFLQKEVSTALQISSDSAKLVLGVVEVFYNSYPEDIGWVSCIFLLEQLMRVSPLLVVNVKETAQKIAFDWKAMIRAESESPSVILVFLLFISTFGLVSAFDVAELRRLYKIVVKHQSVARLHQSFSISDIISESVQIRAEALQLELKSASSSMVLANDVESLRSNVNLESEEQVLCRGQIPSFIQNSSDPAQLVLDALEFSCFSNSQKNKIPQLVAKSVFYLLKQLMIVSPKIKLKVKGRAFKLADSWKSKLTVTNSWEVLAFLQLVAVYGLSSSFGAKYLLGLFEVPPQLLKEASNLIRMLGLEDRVPGFIMELVRRKQRLLAFEYVYEFNLVDKIPPVALLKKHVLHLKMAAKEICRNGQATLEAQDRAIADEISALENVIKCILDHSLQSDYSPDELRERIVHLETQKANLKISMAEEILEIFPKLEKTEEQCAAQNAQLQQKDTRKRPSPDKASTKESRLPPSKKLRCLKAPAETAPHFELSNSHSSHLVQPSPHHGHVLNVSQNDSLRGANPALQEASNLPWQFHSNAGGVNMANSSLSFNQFGWVVQHFPPYRLSAGQFFP